MTDGDGRNIDLRAGHLSGEAAEQRISGDRLGRRTTWDATPSDSAGRDIGYYDLPVVKEPVWIWSVPAYFFVGGAAGVASFLGAVLQIVDREGHEDLIAKCRYIAAGGTTVGTAFLVHDLGRPERFLNMLRVFRPTSAMSMGSWILAAASTGAAVAALGHRAHSGPAKALGDLAGASGAVTGLPLAGYTAVLLSDTAVPVWGASSRTLPWLFLTSASAATSDALALAGTEGKDERLVSRLGTLAKIGELLATAAVGRDADRVERVGEPLRSGLGGRLWKLARALTVSSLALTLVPGRSDKRERVAAAIGLAGGLALRFAVFHAGRASARDPRATFEQQRARLDGPKER